MLLAYRSPECIGNNCKCQYKQYPYKAQIPLQVDGRYPTLTFEKDEDVQKVIDGLVEEVKDINEKKGKDFNIAEAIFGQLPFLLVKDFIF